MNLLLHICCGPCSIYPLRALRDVNLDVTGFFYRSNIHPFTESEKRRQTLASYSEKINLKLIVQEAYDLEGFLQKVVFRGKERCHFCYYDRLHTTALLACKSNQDAFSSTLLYSKYQKHDMIRSIAATVARETGMPFYYQDFRIGWKEGVTASRQMGMYRQQYCGCIYSEKERYDTPSNR